MQSRNVTVGGALLSDINAQLPTHVQRRAYAPLCPTASEDRSRILRTSYLSLLAMSTVTRKSAHHSATKSRPINSTRRVLGLRPGKEINPSCNFCSLPLMCLIVFWLGVWERSQM